MATTDAQLADLLGRNAALFAAYEAWSNGQVMLLAGTVDDPASFDSQGGKTGALGFYPVVNASGQTMYVPCLARLQAVAAGSANPAVLDAILAKQVSAATTAATTAVAARDAILLDPGFQVVAKDLLLGAASQIGLVASGVLDLNALAASVQAATAAATATAADRVQTGAYVTTARQAVTDAQLARDAAMLAGKLYADEPTGRAAVADGAFFSVRGDGTSTFASLYRRVSASAVSTLVATYPSKALIDASIASLNAVTAKRRTSIGRPTGALFMSGGTTSANRTRVFGDPIPSGGAVVTLRARAVGATSVSVRAYDLVGSNFVEDATQRLTIAIADGDNSLTCLIGKPGQYVGCYSAGTFATATTAADGAGIYNATGDVTTVAKGSAITTPQIQIGFDVAITQTDLASKVTQGGLSDQLSGLRNQIIGRPLDCDLLPGAAVGSRPYVYATPAAVPSRVARLTIWAAAAGTMSLRTWTKSGTLFTQTGAVALTLSAGLNTFNADRGDFAALAVSAGQYVGFYGAGAVAYFANVTADSGGYFDAGSAVGDVASFSDSDGLARVDNQFQVRIELDDARGTLVQRVEAAATTDYNTVQPTGYLLVWALGQSNTSGRALDLSANTFVAGQAYKYVRSASNLQLLADPTGNDTIATTAPGRGSWGPAFAKAVQRLSRGRLGVIIVNSAEGGTSLASDWAASGARRAVAQDDLAKALADAAAKGLPITGCCCYMEQGESDGDNGLSQSNYIAAFRNFKTWVDATIGAKVPFLMTRIGTKNTGDTAAYATIRAAQNSLATTELNVALAHTGARNFAARGLMMDTFHYVIAAYDEIGEAVGNAAFALALGQRPLGYTG